MLLRAIFKITDKEIKIFGKDSMYSDFKFMYILLKIEFIRINQN